MMEGVRLIRGFDIRGIDHFVIQARPYKRWTTDDVQPVRQAYAGWPAAGTNFMIRLARQSPGWVIYRHAPPGLGLPPICPEIRPDHAVRTGPPIRHFHGEPELAPPSDQLSPHWVSSPKAMRAHIAGHSNPDDHHGTNSNCIHEHVQTAKYVFPPAPKIDHRWQHDHTAYKAADAYQRHLQGSHKDGDVRGPHGHLRRVKDRTNSLAKRIDVHPFAVPMFESTDTIFFVLEGCLKADAVLTAGAAVFSVPSVTLWDAPELPTFAARYLTGKFVVIVPDADWTQNSLVITQARLCQTRLQRLGVTACVAAPPASAGHKGIDDFLGAGGALKDLAVIDRDPSPALVQFVNDHTNRRDQAQRDIDVLRSLSMHADHEGRITTSLRSVARIMGVPVMRVARGLNDLEAMGAVSIEGSVTTGRGWFSHRPEWKKSKSPIISIAKPLRAIERAPISLGIERAPQRGRYDDFDILEVRADDS